MKFAQRVFWFAGSYGLLALLPQYFLESRVGQDYPPAITHPEFYYGFIGVGVAWQVLFLIVARDPVRYRLMMLPAMLEKATFGIAVLILYAQQRVSGPLLPFAAMDLILCTLFGLAFWRTGKALENKSRLAAP